MRVPEQVVAKYRSEIFVQGIEILARVARGCGAPSVVRNRSAQIVPFELMTIVSNMISQIQRTLPWFNYNEQVLGCIINKVMDLLRRNLGNP